MTPQQSPQTIAVEYINAGLTVIPIPPKTKAPKHPHWQTMRIKASEVNSHFNPSSNIGVILGLNGITDIDLDCPEALAVAPLFLPATKSVFGRPSKPRSHYLYRVNPSPITHKFVDPLTRNSVVELRACKSDGSIGLQTVMPGSIHPAGERVEWAHGPAMPQHTDGAQLEAAVQKIAAASLLAHHWPAKGQRHESCLALIGMLARAGWSQPDTLQFVRGVLSAAASSDSERTSQADANVRDTYGALATGRRTTGFNTLITLMPEGVVRKAVEWLNISPLLAAAEGYPAKRHDLPGDEARGAVKAAPPTTNGLALFDRETADPTGLLAIAGHKQKAQLLNTGVELFAARQKLGKSWLALQIAISVAGGPDVEGLPAQETGPVLYGALEETKARTTNRLRKLARRGAWLENLHFFYELLPLLGGGDEQLCLMVEQFKPRLLILDTFTAVVKSSRNTGDIFRSQYEETTRLRKICEEYGITCLLIHHTRKQLGGDAVESVAGTGGLTAGVDAIWVMNRKPDGYVELQVQGRETPGTSLALRFEEGEPFGWRSVGDAAEFALSQSRKEILEALTETPNQTPAQLAQALNKKPATIQQILKRLAADGRVSKTDNRYSCGQVTA